MGRTAETGMGLKYTQEYKVTWVHVAEDGTYHLVCWGGRWKAFFNNEFIGEAGTFIDGLEIIDSAVKTSLNTAAV